MLSMNGLHNMLRVTWQYVIWFENSCSSILIKSIPCFCSPVVHPPLAVNTLRLLTRSKETYRRLSTLYAPTPETPPSENSLEGVRLVCMRTAHWFDLNWPEEKTCRGVEPLTAPVQATSSNGIARMWQKLAWQSISSPRGVSSENWRWKKT